MMHQEERQIHQVMRLTHQKEYLVHQIINLMHQAKYLMHEVENLTHQISILMRKANYLMHQIPRINKGRERAAPAFMGSVAGFCSRKEGCCHQRSGKETVAENGVKGKAYGASSSVWGNSGK